MARCECCIHEKVCLHRANIQTDTYAYMGIKFDTDTCKHYIAADVAPKSEVAREIFEEIAQIKKEYASGDIDGDTLYVMLHLLEKMVDFALGFVADELHLGAIGGVDIIEQLAIFLVVVHRAL